MMKKVILILFFTVLAVMVMNSCGSSSSKGGAVSTQEVAKVQYTCTMHPEIIRDKQVKCPKCGMTLVEKR